MRARVRAVRGGVRICARGSEGRETGEGGGGARAGAEGRLARVGRVVGSASCSLTGRRRERLTLVAC